MHGPLEVISLSAFVLCVESFGCGHQVWLSTVCLATFLDIEVIF